MKNKRVEIRVSDEELSQISDKAKKARMSRSNYLRQAANNQALVIIAEDELTKLTSELRHIGNNVNQIAVLANMGKIQCTSLDETKAAIEGIWGCIADIRKDLKEINGEV